MIEQDCEMLYVCRHDIKSSQPFFQADTNNTNLNEDGHTIPASTSYNHSSSTVYMCIAVHSSKTNSQPHVTNYNTTGDGNCLFEALSKHPLSSSDPS